MSESHPLPDPEGLPQAIPRKPSPRTLQLVWIIPIVAAIVGGWIALKTVLDRGPTITIQLKSAEGIEAGKTKIKHKSVDVGTVRRIELSPDRKSVIVTAQMDRQSSEGFLVDDTRFWVVRARFAGGQVSGLSTLLAGSYIGADPGTSKNERRDFKGLENPPTITSDFPGREFILSASDLGSLDVGSPVYYRGVTAGRVSSAELAPDGKHVMVGVFIVEPFDKLVNGETRFWNASGIDLSLDASGIRVQSQSLWTLVLGGISFETPPEEAGLPRADPKVQFPLWDNREQAFKPRETIIETYVMKFTQSVRGLMVGAAVDFRGINVGEVRRIDLDFDPVAVRFRAAVEVHIYPERLRSRFRNGTRPWVNLTPRQRMERFVERGLRAQLRPANLLTGQLYIAVDFFENEPKATIDFEKTPPEIPTIRAGGLGELQESLAKIIKNLEKVPFDKIGQDVRAALQNLAATLKRADAMLARIDTEVAPELRATLEQARKTLRAAEGVLGTDSPLQGDLRETLNDVSRTADSLRELVDYLERHPESLIRGKRAEDKK
jgi:paraquat-inducible protein B